MLNKTALTAAALTFASAIAANAELVSKASPHSVSGTVDRLVAAVEGAGAIVFARVDHAAGAASIGADMRPTQMLMFGNPKLGTPVMAMNQAAGLDLPLRVVVYEDAAGKTTLTYHAPSTLSAYDGITEDAEIIGKMTGAIGKLTDKAIAP